MHETSVKSKIPALEEVHTAMEQKTNIKTYFQIYGHFSVRSIDNAFLLTKPVSSLITCLSQALWLMKRMSVIA